MSEINRIDPRRVAYMCQFGLACARPWEELPASLLDQLDLCKSDEARRLLLGVSVDEDVLRQVNARAKKRASEMRAEYRSKRGKKAPTFGHVKRLVRITEGRARNAAKAIDDGRAERMMQLARRIPA